MACLGAGLSFVGLSAAGGLLGGGGLGNMASVVGNTVSGAGGNLMGSFAGNISAVANAVVPGAGFVSGITSAAASLGLTDALGGPITELTGLSGSVGEILNGVGSGVLGGVLTGVVGSGIGLPSGNFIAQMTGHASNLFGSEPLQMVQMMNAAESFSSASLGIAGPLQAAIAGNFGGNISALTSVFPAGGDFGSFLGSAIPDMQALVSNGLSQLVNNLDALPVLGSEFSKLGSAFNLSDIANFGNPGQLVKSILDSGAGGITGISDALASVGLDGVPGINLASPQFNDALNEALATITDSRLIQNAQSILGSNVPGIESLADFTNLSKALPVSFDNIPFDDFPQLAEQLANTNLGTMALPAELGGVINVVSTTDLGSIANTTKLVDGQTVERLINSFLGGTGKYGHVTPSDLAGTVGGVVIKPQGDIVKTGLDYLNSEGLLNDLKDIYEEVKTGLTDDSYPYHSVAGNPTASDSIIDPRDGSVHKDLDSFLGNKVAQIETELASIAGNSNYSSTFNNISSSYKTMQKKVVDEKHLATKTDLQLEIRDNAFSNAYYFADGMADRVTREGSMPIVDGMTEAQVGKGDRYGYYWRAFNAESRNKVSMRPYDVRWAGDYLEEI
jgi:hypothetical protein